jgi:prepilin-type processing-associated H-X9-DG protein
MMRRFVLIVAVAAVLCLLIAGRATPASDLLVSLAFGWVAYCVRVLPKVTVAWEGVTTAVVCLALFAFGLHRTLKWLHGEVRKARNGAPGESRSWSIRWTLSIVGLALLMFVVGISATGIVHQAGWLMASRRSAIQEKLPSRDDWGSSFDHMLQFGLGAAYSLEQYESSASESKGKTVQSWMTKILPGVGFRISGELRDALPWNDPRNSAYFKGIVPLYLNPEIRDLRNSDGYALSHYAGNIHVLKPGHSLDRPASGESANTILAGEVAEGFQPWGDPTNLRDPALGINKIPGGFGGPSGLGANLLFMDGSVRFFRDTTAPDVLRRLSSPKETRRNQSSQAGVPYPAFGISGDESRLGTLAHSSLGRTRRPSP